MFTFLTVGILWLCFAVYWYFRCRKSWDRVGATAIGWVVAAMVALALALAIGLTINSLLPQKTVIRVQKVVSYDHSVPLARWAVGDEEETITDTLTLPAGTDIQDIRTK